MPGMGPYSICLLSLFQLQHFVYFMLAFQIHITSASMTGFIAYGQMVLIRILWVYNCCSITINYVVSIIDT